VAGTAPIAEVELRTMRVRYHRVALPRARSARSSRDALWLGNGLLAVSGQNSPRAPAGVHVVDTRTWTARTVDRRAGQAKLVAGRLLVHTDFPRESGIGLRVYTRDGGRLVRHVLGGQALDVEVAGSRAYAYRIAGRRRALYVIDARSGSVVRTTRPPPRRSDLEILGR
jgi:hypothetical protein